MQISLWQQQKRMGKTQMKGHTRSNSHNTLFTMKSIKRCKRHSGVIQISWQHHFHILTPSFSIWKYFLGCYSCPTPSPLLTRWWGGGRFDPDLLVLKDTRFLLGIEKGSWREVIDLVRDAWDGGNLRLDDLLHCLSGTTSKLDGEERER